ncbi:MAG: 5'-nucleotidase C-terminal domain-containing protein, partial [Bacteroidia bacterium]
PKGEITRGKIFELMPFDNEIVIITISGAQMQDLLKYIAASGGQPCAGLNMGIRNDKTVGAVSIQGQAFDVNKNYKVATSDYLAGGGDKMSFFNNPIKVEVVGLKIRDALIERCREMTKAGMPIGSKLDGRIHYETE